ncbi:ribosomal large subunit pseudouridine synthase family protein, partial [Prevotella sp. MGM2]
MYPMTVLYEDNHIIIVSKAPGEIVQGDKTGDCPLSETVKAYLKEKYAKPGKVFLGVVHRLDRPVSGVVVFARTGKALSRLNEMFRTGKVRKTYHAIVTASPAVLAGEASVRLEHWLTRNEKQNKAYAHRREVSGSKQAILDFRTIGRSERYA